MVADVVVIDQGCQLRNLILKRCVIGRYGGCCPFAQRTKVAPLLLTQLGPVAIANKISSVSVISGDRTLFQSIKPIKEDLGIRTDCIVGMGSLNGMLMKKCHNGLNNLHRIGEENRKARERGLT